MDIEGAVPEVLNAYFESETNIEKFPYEMSFELEIPIDIASKKLEELSDIEFLSEKNESLKNIIIVALTEGKNKGDMQKKINTEYAKLIDEIKENSNIQLITKDKNDQDILDLLKELIINFKEQNNLKKIESLEKKLINNLDENSYSELIKLKSQLNRD